MTAAKLQPPIDPIAYTAPKAAAALDVGLTFFQEHVAPELRVVRVSGKVLYPVDELRRWVRESAAHTLRQAA